jgi:hypothetical protein
LIHISFLFSLHITSQMLHNSGWSDADIQREGWDVDIFPASSNDSPTSASVESNRATLRRGHSTGSSSGRSQRASGDGLGGANQDFTRADLRAANLLIDDDDDGLLALMGRGRSSAGNHRGRGVASVGVVGSDEDRDLGLSDMGMDDIHLMISDEEENDEDDADADLQRIRRENMRAQRGRRGGGEGVAGTSRTSTGRRQARNFEEFSSEEAEMNRVILMSLQDSIGQRGGNEVSGGDGGSVQVSEETVGVLLNMGFTRDQYVPSYMSRCLFTITLLDCVTFSISSTCFQYIPICMLYICTSTHSLCLYLFLALTLCLLILE